MARGRRKREEGKKNSGANLGFEAQLWQAADALRGNMDAAEYKHVTLGLIPLKYISDAFEEYHAKFEAERADNDWCREMLRDDKRWVYGVPPAGDALRCTAGAFTSACT